MDVFYNNIDIDSTSDDGSVFEEGDTYLQVNMGIGLMDSSYSPSFIKRMAIMRIC